MDKEQQDQLIPEKIEGKNNEVEESVICEDRDQAIQKFKEAAEKLLNINCWRKTANTPAGSAEFQLVDDNGNPLYGNAREGVYIKIDVPGPGPKAGNGFDWVCIEKIIDQRDANADNELVGIQVRACSDPNKKENDTAHFFTDLATSTFIIERENETIYSRYFGRNEVINNDTNTLDKIRNSLVGLAAKLGFSEIQWKLLLQGFLK